MNAPEVLERLTAAGVRLTASGGNIIAAPRSAVTPEVVELVRAHKPELLQTLEQRTELVALVNRVATYHAFTDEQRQEALEIALADPGVALECFRGLAAEIPTSLPEREV